MAKSIREDQREFIEKKCEEIDKVDNDSKKVFGFVKELTGKRSQDLMLSMTEMGPHSQRAMILRPGGQNTVLNCTSKGTGFLRTVVLLSTRLNHLLSRMK